MDIKRAVEGKGGIPVERIAVLGRSTAIPLAAGTAVAKGGRVGDLVARGCQTTAARAKVVVAVAPPAPMPFGSGRSSASTARVGHSATATAMLGPAGSISEFAVPTPLNASTGIASGPDDNLWFTEETSDKIGRITP